MPEITVVITTYNLEMTIAECLEELLLQTFQDFDVLIVDDCSSDITADIVKRYISLYPERIRSVFLTENLGNPARTRNVAMDSGKIDGNYVIFLDGDDSIDITFLETLYTLAVSTDAEIAICAYDRIERATKRVLCVEMLGFPETIDCPPNSDVLAFINGSLWNKLLKRSIIGDTRIPCFRVGEDLCFLQILYQKCNRIAFTEKILIHYLIHGNSVIANTNLEDIHDFAAELKELRDACTNITVKQSVELISFIHIGISMAIRARANRSISLGCHLSWTRAYLSSQFGFFRGNRLFGLQSLRRHGLKGYALWGCLVLYRLYLFRVFLVLYEFFTKVFRIDIKF